MEANEISAKLQW